MGVQVDTFAATSTYSCISMNNAILNLILQMQLDLQYHHDMSHISKAGRLVGKADCFAVIALADNATFLLAVNRIAALR